MEPKLWIKIEDEPEFEISEKIPQLQYLGEDYGPSMENNYQTFSAVDGSFFNFSNFKQNIVNENFILHFNNIHEQKSLQYEVYRMFMNKKLIRLHNNSEYPFIKYVRAVDFEVEPWRDGAKDALITIPFENPSGYNFSRNKSDDQDDVWDVFPLGWNIPEFAPDDFEFKKNKFKIYNPSDMEIDPYYQKHELKMLLKYNSDDSIALSNATNGSLWALDKPSDGTDEVVVDGINTYFNGSQANVNTNYGTIKFDKGWNEMSVIGAADIDITFSFPFIYV